jgi:hypothetical protein
MKKVSLAKTLSLSAALDDQQRKAIGATVASAKKVYHHIYFQPLPSERLVLMWLLSLNDN